MGVPHLRTMDEILRQDLSRKMQDELTASIGQPTKLEQRGYFDDLYYMYESPKPRSVYPDTPFLVKNRSDQYMSIAAGLTLPPGTITEHPPTGHITMNNAPVLPLTPLDTWQRELNHRKERLETHIRRAPQYSMHVDSSNYDVAMHDHIRTKKMLQDEYQEALEMYQQYDLIHAIEVRNVDVVKQQRVLDKMHKELAAVQKAITKRRARKSRK